MDIRTNPGYRLYVGDNVCFPTGKSPKKLYATISGVETGEAWYPGLPPAPNGTYVLEQSEVGLWGWYSEVWDITFVLATDRTIFFASYGSSGDGFFFYKMETCLFSGDNFNVNEFDYFYGGGFVVGARD
jgi:hypothetical protein